MAGETNNPTPGGVGLPEYSRRSKPDARYPKLSMADMTTEDALPSLLGKARHQTYVDAANGNLRRAAELYEWNTQLAAAWHSHIGYIEVAVRNAIDRELTSWNARRTDRQGAPYGRDWSLPGRADPLIYSIVGRALQEAHANAVKESTRRPRHHARRGVEPNHDDVISQLTFGAWARLITSPQGPDRSRTNRGQVQLWDQVLSRAFPGAESAERGRIWVGRQLEGIRRLRNRIAHHENLLSVDTVARLNGSLALLASVDPDFPALVMSSNSLRQLAEADPRQRWAA